MVTDAVLRCYCYDSTLFRCQLALCYIPVPRISRILLSVLVVASAVVLLITSFSSVLCISTLQFPLAIDDAGLPLDTPL